MVPISKSGSTGTSCVSTGRPDNCGVNFGLSSARKHMRGTSSGVSSITCGEPAFRHHLLQIAVAERVPQIHRTHSMMITSSKYRTRNSAGRFWITVSPYQIGPRAFATDPPAE